MSASTSLREKQTPLKERYESDPESAKLTITVRSVTTGDDPTRCRIQSEAGGGIAWDVGAHPMAGGNGDLACSGDLLLASLAACQEITLRMVAVAMGIHLEQVEISVHGEMDFRGTMGLDQETPVGFQRIRTDVRIVADAPEDRLQRLVQRAERYCVVASTLRDSPNMETTFQTAQLPGPQGPTVAGNPRIT